MGILLYWFKSLSIFIGLFVYLCCLSCSGNTNSQIILDLRDPSSYMSYFQNWHKGRVWTGTVSPDAESKCFKVYLNIG